MKAKVTYFFSATCQDLVDFITDHINEVLTGKVTEFFSTINFRVADTPSAEEANAMSQKELANAYDCATGTYGVTLYDPFDQCDQITIAVGYYGGRGMKMFSFPTDEKPIPRHKIRAKVYASVLDVMASNCDDGISTNFIINVVA